MEFFEDSKVQYHFYGEIKNYPFSKSVLKSRTIFWVPFCTGNIRLSISFFYLQMETLFREREKYRMHSKSETSGFCNNVEVVCVLDSNQSSPTYRQITEAPWTSVSSSVKNWDDHAWPTWLFEQMSDWLANTNLLNDMDFWSLEKQLLSHNTELIVCAECLKFSI